jgi:hypothetical protein
MQVPECLSVVIVVVVVVVVVVIIIIIIIVIIFSIIQMEDLGACASKLLVKSYQTL